MTGYCSNSPARCQHALQLDILTTDDHRCPECYSPLLQRPERKMHPILVNHGFQLGLVVFMLLALLLVCVAFD